MPKPKVTTSTFQGSDDLNNETVIAEYLSSAAQDENPGAAEGVGRCGQGAWHGVIGQGLGLGRESLYKALSPGAKPRYETVAAVMRALKLKMKVVVGVSELGALSP